METVFVGLCTAAGIGIAMGVTRLGLGVIIQMIPSREESQSS